MKYLRERLKVHIDGHAGFALVKMLHAGSVAKGSPGELSSIR